MPATVFTSSFQPISSRSSPLFSSAKFLSGPLDASGKIAVQMYIPHATSNVKYAVSTVHRHHRGRDASQRSASVAPIAISMGDAACQVVASSLAKQEKREREQVHPGQQAISPVA